MVRQASGSNGDGIMGKYTRQAAKGLGAIACVLCAASSAFAQEDNRARVELERAAEAMGEG